MAGSSIASTRRAESGAADRTTGGQGGVLYVVATPIGNLEDLTLRALRTLREVDVIAAEDTRHTRVLLRHHGIETRVVSYHDAVERSRAPQLVERLVAGESIALVSDAGTPGVSDPGYHLVRAALAAGVLVVPIPGPSAVVSLVSVAGLAVDRFAFEGFLPARSSGRRRRLRALVREPRAMVLYESARRLDALLADALDVLGDREAVIGRELTKLHEEIRRGTLAALGAWWASEATTRGEVTMIIAGVGDGADAVPEAFDVDAALREGRKAGRGLKEVAAELAERTGRPRRELYQRGLALFGSD